MNLKQLFKSPGSAYRGKPFWAWNGKLTEEEVRRQIRVFKQMGLGGAFMHSRVGLATPYLQDEWFKIVRACCDECKNQEMEAWLYDEDRWPSGAAGGLVTGDERFRHRHLELELHDPADFTPDGTELGMWLGAIADRTLRNQWKYRPGTAAPGDKVLAFKVNIDEPSPWYNGQTYLDTMNPEAVAKFIKLTHKAYEKKVLKDYSSTIVPGIFTDEPNHGHQTFDGSRGRVSWTEQLPRVFEERYGYDILEHLPELFFVLQDEPVSRVRRDFHDCLTYLFTHAFAKQIGEWCEANQQQHTGHVLAEETLSSQTAVVGSAMRFYEYMQAPGIDILSGQILQREGGRKPEYTTAKQCSSVQHQFRRKWMLSELYGCTGWHFSFAEHKAVGDWQAALGVNLRCQHLAWYTMLGQAKRDYPASIFFQSAWWQDYPVVEDYFARVNLLLTQGEPVRDVALLHPIESAWTLFHADPDGLARLDQDLETVQQALLEAHFDFDYVDEDILARHGAVKGNELCVALAVYKTVVVPPLLTMRATTLALLGEFQAAGGQLIFVGPAPGMLDCRFSEEAPALASQATTVSSENNALTEVLRANRELLGISVQDAAGVEYPHVLYMLRHDAVAGRYVLFLCHTRQEAASGPLTVCMPRLAAADQAQLQEWNAEMGEISAAEFTETKDGVSFKTELEAYGSRLFVLDPKELKRLKPRPAYRELRNEALTPKQWTIERDEPNAFVLDCPAWRLDGGKWQKPLEILKLDMKVRDAAGLPRRGGAMVQPWAQEAPPASKPVQLELRYEFTVKELPAGPCHLVLELPERFDISLNTHSLKTDKDEGWWIDNSFKRIRVAPKLLQVGANELVLKTEYTNAYAGLEAIYFTGEFGMKWKRQTPEIIALPDSLKLGDWCGQGFPCYTGALSYITEFEAKPEAGERVFVSIPEWQGVLLKVRVNGVEIGKRAWPPYELDITGALQPKANRLELQLVASRRNLLGPLHNTTVYPVWTGPGEFVTSGEQWTNKYISVPCGLMAPPTLSYRA